MKTTSEQKSTSLGTDESVAAQEFDNSCRKEKKEKRKDRKKIEVDTDAMMTSNEQRMGEKQKSGKKRHKEDVMVEDDDKGQEEIQKKKKKRKKDKNDVLLNGDGDDRETEKKKNKKKDRMVSFDEETEVKDTEEEEEEEETAAVEVEDARSVDREKVKMDATKADNDEKKKKKRKEKKTKVDETAGDEEHKNTHETLEKEKKQNVKERGDEVEDGGETNGSKMKKKERKKRKDDVAVGDEEHKEKVKEKKQSVKESGDEVVDCKETNGYKEKKKKEKKRKEKNNGDNLTAGDEEQKKQVKEKKGNAAVHEGNRSGNEGEHLKGRRDEGKKRKSNTDDRGGAANSDPSEHPTPRTRKVSFSDKVKVFDRADSETADKEDDLVWGKRFTREEDEAIMNSVHEYIETHHLGEEGLYMILHCKKFPKIRGCWDEIAAALPHRPASSIYYRGHNLFERGDNKWTKEELELVKESYEKHGRKYKLIAEELGKHRVHVKDAVRRLQFANANQGRWTQEEYQNLYDLVSKDLQMKLFEEKKSKHGMLRDNICWGAISTQMKTRAFSSCCDKWYKQLRSPMVVEGTWADADDYRLLLKLTELDASCEDEVDWDYLLEHRSGDLSRKRWKQMVDHLGENGNKSFSEQIEVLSKRYCPDLLEVREALDARPVVD